MAAESKLEGRVVKWAKAHKIIPLKVSPVSDGGYPDHMWLFYYPAIAFIEFKAPGKAPDPRQEERIARLRKRGYPVEVIDDYDKGIAFLEAAVLSNRRDQAWDHAGMRWIPIAPRDGQDNDCIRDR